MALVYKGGDIPYWTWGNPNHIVPVDDAESLRKIALLDAAADENGEARLPTVGRRLLTDDGRPAYGFFKEGVT